MKVLQGSLKRLGQVAMLILTLVGAPSAMAVQNLPFNLQPPFTQLDALELGADQQQWLATHGVLRVGISIVDHEPIDITGDRNRYQGISADYLSLVATRLGASVQVIGFARRDAAVAALQAGEIDILTSANGGERKAHGLSFSADYLPDRAVVVRSADTASEKSPAIKKVALVDGYTDPDLIQRLYPGSEVVVAPMLGSALEALKAGEVDALIANEIVIRAYQVLRPYIALNIVGLAPLPAVGYAFGTRTAEPLLGEMIDSALASIDESLRREVISRWTAGLGSDIAQRRIELSAAEQAWVDRHPQVRVVATQYPPYLYLDRQGRWVGLNSDILATLANITGLRFVYVPSQSIAQSLQLLKSGEADMNTTLSETPERKAYLNFSHSYGGNGWAFIVRAGDMPPGSLEEMAGRTLALPAEHALEVEIRQQYPDIRLRLVGTYEKARELVASGEADATLDSELGAHRAVARHPAGVLKVGRTVEGRWSPDRFAVSTRHPELYSILNKALEAYPVAELRAVRLRWLGAVAPPEPVWQRLAQWTYWAGGAAVLFGLASLIWGGRLRAQIRQRERVEQALSDQLAFQQALLDNLPTPVYVRDLQGRLLSCNKSYEQRFHKRQDQLKGLTLPESDIVSPKVAEQMHRDYLQLLKDQQPVFADRQIATRGSLVEARQWIVPFYRADGQLQGLLGGWVDVTNREGPDPVATARDPNEPDAV